MYKQDDSTTLFSSFETQQDYIDMLEAAINQSDIGFLISDGSGKVIKINQGQINITGQPPEYNLGKNMRDVQVDDGSPSATVMVLDSGKSVKIEQHLVNGHSYLVYAKPYFSESGSIKYVISNLLDTTEINQTFEAIREDNEKLSIQLAELQNKMNSQKKIIHQSWIMRRLLLLCDRIAQFDSAVLLQGESGVGKEKIAEYIFEKSTRSQKPFIKINCAAIPENLLESELFGYEPGSFTGADRKGKKGLLEYADSGTLLLDEISELTLPLQVKLLRFLQNGEFYRVGGRKLLTTDVRIIAATNKILSDLVKEESFREDLYYRLNVIPVNIPPLRERTEDIPLLIGYFTKIFNEKHGLNKTWDIAAITRMTGRSYKGNVRELQNTVERILVLSESETISEMQVIKILDSVNQETDCDYECGLKEMVAIYEAQIIKQYMEKYGTEERASKVLKVSQSTISRKLSQFK